MLLLHGRLSFWSKLDSASAIEYKRKVSDPKSPQIKGEMYSLLPDPWKSRSVFLKLVEVPHFRDTASSWPNWTTTSFSIPYAWYFPSKRLGHRSDEPHLPLARLIFDYPTIASVASYASEQLGAAAGATMHVPMAVAGSKPKQVCCMQVEICSWFRTLRKMKISILERLSTW